MPFFGPIKMPSTVTMPTHSKKHAKSKLSTILYSIRKKLQEMSCCHSDRTAGVDYSF